MTDRDKHPTSYRLTPECRTLIEELARALGISRSGVIEIAVREKAKRETVAPKAKAR